MSYIQVSTVFSGIGLTGGGHGGCHAFSPSIFFLPKNSFFLTAELKRGR